MSAALAERRFSRVIPVALTMLSMAVAILAWGTSNASATFLCSNPSCDAYPAGTSLAASLEKGTLAKLLSNIGTVECESSAIAGKTLEEAGEPLALEVTKLSFEKCKLGETSCTVTTATLPTSPSLKATGSSNGTLSLEGGFVEFKCGAFIKCNYPMKPLQVKGGNPATLSAEKLPMTGGKGFLCPKTSELDATYTLAEPAPAYAVESEGQTLLCRVSSCTVSDVYPASTPLAASLAEGTSAQLLTNIGTVKCESSSIVGETTAEAGKPLPLEITELTFGKCKLGETACTATTSTLPTSPSLEATGEDNGVLSLAGGEVHFECGVLVDCTYTMPTLQVKGGNPAVLSAEEVVPKYVKGALCPGANAFDITYTVSEPAPVYVAM